MTLSATAEGLAVRARFNEGMLDRHVKQVMTDGLIKTHNPMNPFGFGNVHQHHQQ